jgi:hypothetical protein
MWAKKVIIIVTMIVVAGLVRCIEPYNPPEVEQAESLLVVDGYVDLGLGSATISLTRTKNLSESNILVHQSNAQVSIEIEGGPTIPLQEIEQGVYSTDNIFLSETDNCKLHIRVNGKEYESELVSIKPTPEIDSVTYVQDASGIQIDVTTHDPANNTWFYQWQYVETARYNSKFQSLYYWRGPDDIAFRTQDNDLFVCWKTIPSTSILIATSSSLTSDLIYKFPLVFLPADSWKLEYRYSILIRQFAIDEKTYNYWQQIKKNTETIGSLFDPQPSQVTGNIRCLSDPSESVLGYFSVRAVDERRVYIDRSDLPDYKSFDNGYQGCLFSELDTLLLADLDLSQPVRDLLISGVTPPMGTQIIGYTTHNPACIDCRIVHEGTTQPPDWWEE